MRIITKSLLLLVALTVSSLACSETEQTSSHQSSQTQPLDRIVAIANDSVITDNELNAQVGLIADTLKKRNMPLPPESVLRKQVLEHMIDSDLEMQLAQKAGVQVDSHDVDEAIENIAKEHHMTMAQMHKTVESQGMLWKAYRHNIKKELTINRLQQKAVGQITVTDQQVESYLASNSQAQSAQMNMSYHLEDILIPLSANPSSKEVQIAEQRANKVLKKLKNGANFNELAVAESGGQDALQGGDLGFRRLPELPEAFAQRVVTMKEGDLSGPIRTANGWHVIKLVAVQGANGQGAGPTKEQVRNFLYQRKYNEAVEDWLMQLRSTAYIKVFL